MGNVFDFIANTSDGVFVVDRQQTIVLWNQGATAILGYPAAEVLGKRCGDVVQGRDTEGCIVCTHECPLFKAATHEHFHPAIDLKTRTRNGLEIWINVSSVVFTSPRHELTAFIHLFREVTSQHRLADTTRRLADMVSGRASHAWAATDQAPTEPLTHREREVLKQLATGASSQTIADHLSVSTSTVRNHATNLLKKLGVHSRLEAVAIGIRRGLV